MDMQYSGLIDFNPLLKQLSSSPPRRNKGNSFYANALSSQRSLMKDVGQARQARTQSSIIGSHINMMA